MQKKLNMTLAVCLVLAVPLSLVLIDQLSNPVASRLPTTAKVLKVDGKSAKVKLENGKTVTLNDIVDRIQTGDEIPVIIDVYRNLDRGYRLDPHALMQN